jgi:alpha-beta hydrolase superfamily lysophospholipase
VKILQSSRESQDGLKLHIQSWEPDRRPKAVVVVVHGLGEHIARYVAVAEILVNAGFAVVGYDQRGHGRSDGRRGHAPRYDALLDDLSTVLDLATARYPRRPVFLYGHSLGGALAINHAMRRLPKLVGVIASSPLLKALVPAPPLKVALAHILDPILPTYTERWGSKPADLSQDASVGDAYARDLLVHNFITVRMYRAWTQAGLWALEHAAEFPLPLLLMHGTGDRVTSFEASLEFARRLGKKCTLKLWEGAYHELHNELERPRVLRTMILWMNRRLENGRTRPASAGQMRPAVRKSRPIPRQRA